MSNENTPVFEIPDDFNRGLEEKILKANEDKTLVKWNKLLPELMMSDIILAGLFQNGQTDGKANLLVLQHEGRNLVPFFTSPDRMKVLPEEQVKNLNMIKMRAGDFFHSIRGMGTVLNPSTDYARLFSGFDTKVLALEFEQSISEKANDTK